MSSFWRLMRYLGNYRALLFGNIISNIFTAVFTVVAIPLLAPFLNLLFSEDESQLTRSLPPDTEGLNYANEWLNYQLSKLILQLGKEQALLYVIAAIITAFFLKNLFRYLALFFMAPVRNGIVRDLRQQMFDKVLLLPLAYFSEERKGDTLSRISGDVQEVEGSILNVLESVFREPLIIIGSLAYMLSVSFSLTAFVFGLILFTGFIIGGIGRTLKRSSSVVQEKLGTIVAIVEEALGGMRIIKGFNAEAYQQGKFAKENNDYRYTLTRLLWRRDLSSPLSEFLSITVVALLLWYGSKQVFSGNMDAEVFLAFIFAFYNVIDPAKSFSKAYYHIQKGIGAMDRIEVILDAPNTILEKPDALPIRDFQSEIVYQNVSFAYKKEEPVLENIDLRVAKGKLIALVGPSGAGKSTMVDLLPRFYDVTAGSMLIDGTNIRDYRLQDLRSLMGIVSQDAILFNDTIYNNIVFGLKNVRAEEVEEAARIAYAHDFIMATEAGYQTNIGDRGNKLSGGQRQRLTIARAILKNPSILILDEATSALDSESEKLVQAALVELMKNRTSIVIAHRLSTIQHADEIIVMKSGRIIERGTHQDLLNNPQGEYRKLVALQAF